jgi:hypothetical protein
MEFESTRGGVGWLEAPMRAKSERTQLSTASTRFGTRRNPSRTHARRPQRSARRHSMYSSTASHTLAAASWIVSPSGWRPGAAARVEVVADLVLGLEGEVDIAAPGHGSTRRQGLRSHAAVGVPVIRRFSVVHGLRGGVLRDLDRAFRGVSRRLGPCQPMRLRLRSPTRTFGDGDGLARPAARAVTMSADLELSRNGTARPSGTMSASVEISSAARGAAGWPWAASPRSSSCAALADDVLGYAQHGVPAMRRRVWRSAGSLVSAAVKPVHAVLAAALRSGMKLVRTRENHRPDMSDCPPTERSLGGLVTGITLTQGDRRFRVPQRGATSGRIIAAPGRHPAWWP